MKYIKVEAIIPIDENFFPLVDKDDINWFTDLMNDKENISIQIWSNDIGDEVCSNTNFKWKFYNQNK
jgi:hypothetical protein